MTWGTITGNFGALNADSNDPGQAPDLEPVSGSVTITPRLPLVKILDLTTPLIAINKTIVCQILNGVLVGPDGNPGVRVVATNSPGIEPFPLQWDVRIMITGATTQPSPMTIDVPGGGTVNLATIVPSPPAVPVVTVVSEQTKIDAMAARNEAQAAATSANTANTNAQSAKTAAETARNAANTANTNAQAANTAAQSAKTGAETAAAAAETSRLGSVSSASAAATSVTAAQTARTGAETARTQAQTSATNASNSATAAASSATAASTSATNAANSAASAAAPTDTQMQTLVNNASSLTRVALDKFYNARGLSTARPAAGVRYDGMLYYETDKDRYIGWDATNNRWIFVGGKIDWQYGALDVSWKPQGSLVDGVPANSFAYGIGPGHKAYVREILVNGRTTSQALTSGAIYSLVAENVIPATYFDTTNIRPNFFQSGYIDAALATYTWAIFSWSGQVARPGITFKVGAAITITTTSGFVAVPGMSWELPATTGV